MPGSEFRILVINPGSTSTKTALFLGKEKAAERTLEHSVEDLRNFEHLSDQLFFREAVIRRFLREAGWQPDRLDAVVGRGGLLHPLDGGIYRINAMMLAHLRSGRFGIHASNLGAQLAREFALLSDCPAFIVDPVVVDELDGPARLSGHPALPRRSIFHALNQRAVARLAAEDMDRDYEKSRFIVCHMGGGITIGVHNNGRVVDVNNGLDGDGPFTPERSGSLPAGQMVELCFHSRLSEREIRQMIKGTGGIAAYCGTNDVRQLVRRAEAGLPADNQTGTGKPIPATDVLEAFCRQIAQAVCAHGATLEGEVDGIVFTGGVAHSTVVMERLRQMCAWVAPIIIVPGEREMEALADGALRALEGREHIKEYQ